MYITRLSSDEWDETGRHYDPRETDTPGEAEVEAAIQRLDGRRWTVVTLEASDERYMGIGGGSDGRYLVFVAGPAQPETDLASAAGEAETDADETDEDTVYVLLAPNAEHIPAEAEARLYIAGEETIHPLRHCVDLDTALRAAHTYAETGALDPTLTWEREEETEVEFESDFDVDDSGEADEE